MQFDAMHQTNPFTILVGIRRSPCVFITATVVTNAVREVQTGVTMDKG